MAEQTLGIRIKIDSDTGKLTVLNKEFDSLGKSSAQASSQLSSFDGTMAAINTRMVALVAAGYTAKSVFDMTVGSGIALNSQFEQMKLGIASLIAVNSSNTTAMGHSISTAQKFQMAQAQAAESVDLLRKANLQTPATLAQITEGYQAALGPSLRLGMSTKQTVEYVKLMTMAAAAMGQPMEQIAQESRALLSGEIDMNAQVARNLQITNEQIKMHTKQGDLYEFLTKKLGDFAAGGEAMSNSWEGISSNITDSIQTIQQKATEGIFDALKADGIDLQHKLSDNANEIADAFAHGFSNAYLVAAPAAENIYLAFEVSLSGINVLLNSFTDMFDTSVDGMNNKYRELGFFDYLSLSFIVAIEGFRQLGDVGLSVITFLGSMMNKFQSITLDAFAGIAGGMGALTDLIGLDGSSFYESQAYWVKKSNAVKQDSLLIDQTQKAILGDMAKGADRLAHSYNQLALIKDKPTRPGSNDRLTSKQREEAAKTAAELKKAEAQAKKDAAEREKDRLEEIKIQKGYLDSYAEMEAKTAIEEYDNKLKYLEAYADMEAKLAIEQYENELKYLYAYSEMEAKAAIKKYEEQNKFLVDLFGDVEKAMHNQLFDAMTGKWTDFGDWFKDFWSSLSTSIMRAFSAQMSDSLMNTMKGAMGMETSGGGIQNIFSQFGLFGGSSQGSNAINVGVGTTLTSDQVARFGGTSGESFTTNSGTVISSSGQILTAGTDITDIAKSVPTSTYASYIQDAYGTVSGWFGAGGGLSSAELAAGEMANAGTATAGSSASSGLLGTAGTALGWAAFFKTLSGFLWSDNGLNKLFGTDYGTIAHDTMKYGAGSYDWSSGQLNSGYGYLTDSSLWARNASYMNPYNLPQMAGYDSRDWARMSYAAQINPLSAITGHMDPIFAGIIGGLFGSGETTSMMLQGEQYNRTNIGTSSEGYSSGNQTGWLYSSTDGGLFGGGGDSFLQLTQALPQSALDGIKSYIGAFNNILSEMGVAEKMIVAGGNFSSVQQFLDTNVLYTFFDKLTDADSIAVTNAWKDYATSISKSTMEAFNEVVGGMIGYKRSFEEWYLGSGTIEQLRFTTNYLQTDLEKYAKSIGAVGVTTDNFLTKYEDAMTALYTPETSEAWQKLGQSLMAATDASKALQNQVNSVIVPQDMILSKSTDGTNIFQTLSTQTDNMKYSFAEMIQILRKILYNQQFGLQPV